MQAMKEVFITGGTGYIGSRLIKQLLERKHRVTALVRKGSEHKLPSGVTVITADPFDAASFAPAVPGNAVFVQLLGVSHPSPKKARQFREIDLRSVKASADAAGNTAVSNFIYVSVAMHPSKLMEAYQFCRSEGETYCLSKGFNCTFIRPWYVIGPAHWWPLLLLPVYAVAEIVPAWRQKARSVALVTIRQMITTLIQAVEATPLPHNIIEIKQIRQSKI